jgi:Tol biopolymer transport system component
MKLVILLGTGATLMFVALVALGIGIGQIAASDVIAFNIFCFSCPATKQIFIIDVPTRIQRSMGSAYAFATDFAPQWSPDASQLVYHRYRSPDDLLICITDIFEGDTRCSTYGASPAWSSDGQRLAFVFDNVIYIMDIPTGAIFNLTHHMLDASETNVQALPTWRPHGDVILFQQSVNGFGELFTVEPDGENLRNLTRNGAHDSNPVWSSDGRHIAFLSDRDHGEPSQLYVMEADGSQPRRITQTPNSIEDFAWSPDGMQIAFFETTAASSEIFVVNADGTHLQWLAKGTFPSWSPDGRDIAFIAGSNPFIGEIYVIHRDGAGIYRLTNTNGQVEGRAPAWHP